MKFIREYKITTLWLGTIALAAVMFTLMGLSRNTTVQITWTCGGFGTLFAGYCVMIQGIVTGWLT